MAHLLPFMLFSLVASITPGPTNILVLGHSARYGLRSALPLVAGGCVAAATVAGPTFGLALLALLFLLISLPCMALWAGMGTAAHRLLPSARGMARFNRAMAVLLLAAAWMAAPL